jgi:hypothetical protein
MIYLEQRAMSHLFTRKELKAREIYTEPESVHGPEALALPTVKKWPRHLHQGKMDLFDGPRSGGPLTNDFAGAMGSMLEERPFSSRKALCRRFWIGKATCFRIHHSKFGLKTLYLRWVPRAISINGKMKELHFRSSSGGTDGTENERLSPDYHRG